MVVVTTEEMLDKMITINKAKATVEAGELIVKGGDAIIPSKLRILADAGWTIQDVWKNEGGFSLLLTRNVSAYEVDKRE